MFKYTSAAQANEEDSLRDSGVCAIVTAFGGANECFLGVIDKSKLTNYDVSIL